MAFGWAGASAGASDALEQMLVQKRAEMLQQQQLAMQQAAAQQQQSQFDATLGQRTREFTANEADRTAQRERQGRLDDVAAGARRREINMDEVRKLAFEGVRTGAASPHQARLMAGGEGVDIGDLTDPAQQSEQKFNEQKRVIDLQHRNRLAEIGAQGAESRATQAARPVTPTSGANTPGSDYASMTADRTIAAIDDVLPKINMGTAGVVGNLLGRVGYQPAVNVSAELSTVAGNIAFNALQQMREASKTGGALGQVSERELDLLSAVEGSLRQNQSPENLKAQLQKVRESMQRFKAAQALGESALGMGRTSASAPAPAAGGFRILSVED